MGCERVKRERVGCERGGRWGEIEGRGKEESR